MSGAFYSARAGAAFIPANGNGWLRLTARHPDRLDPCSASEVAVALRDCNDVVEIPPSDLQVIRSRLGHSIHVMNASDLTLWLLDATLSDTTRQSAACELNPFFADAEIVESWRGVFWWEPLGPAADIENALRLASGRQAKSVVDHLVHLRDRQPAIANVRGALESVLVSNVVERQEVNQIRNYVRGHLLHVAIVEEFARMERLQSGRLMENICRFPLLSNEIAEKDWFKRWLERLNPASDEDTTHPSTESVIENGKNVVLKLPLLPKNATSGGGKTILMELTRELLTHSGSQSVDIGPDPKSP